MRSLLTLLLLIFMPVPKEISMAGIKINDPKSVLQTIKLKLAATDKDAIRYKTANGNDLSVTIDNGKIVYLENDWRHGPQSAQPLFTSFEFGKTTLQDIRNTLGTNGFAYDNNSVIATGTDVVIFNCFEFDSPNNEVLVTVAKLPLSVKTDAAHIAGQAKLAAVILAKKEYLDKIWQLNKVYDKNNKKIKY